MDGVNHNDDLNKHIYLHIANIYVNLIKRIFTYTLWSIYICCLCTNGSVVRREMRIVGNLVHVTLLCFMGNNLHEMLRMNQPTCLSWDDVLTSCVQSNAPGPKHVKATLHHQMATLTFSTLLLISNVFSVVAIASFNRTIYVRTYL